MAERRRTLDALGLSPPLLAFVTGQVPHPAVAREYRFFPDDPSRPSRVPPAGLVPLWEDADGPPHFHETVYARLVPGGPEFWSTIDEAGADPDPGRLLTRTEPGLLFWVFHHLLQRQLGVPAGTDWDLPGLAGRLGFRHFPDLMAYWRACAAGLDTDDRVWDVVRGFPDTLPPDRAGQPEWLVELGEAFLDRRKYADARAEFRAAWDALPGPKGAHPLAVRILAATADCEFRLGNWEACRDAVRDAVRCGLPLDDVFARLRLGQSLYELGHEAEAANWLAPVYVAHGRRPFAADDPKYLEFFRSGLRSPEGGWPEGW